jgi:hypothetical protein
VRRGRCAAREPEHAAAFKPDSDGKGRAPCAPMETALKDPLLGVDDADVDGGVAFDDSEKVASDANVSAAVPSRRVWLCRATVFCRPDCAAVAWIRSRRRPPCPGAWLAEALRAALSSLASASRSSISWTPRRRTRKCDRAVSCERSVPMHDACAASTTAAAAANAADATCLGADYLEALSPCVSRWWSLEPRVAG